MLESESLVQSDVALAGSLQIGGHALAVAASKRWAEQRRAEALALGVRYDAHVGDVVVRFPDVAVFHLGDQRHCVRQPRAEHAQKSGGMRELRADRHPPRSFWQLERRARGPVHRPDRPCGEHYVPQLEPEEACQPRQPPRAIGDEPRERRIVLERARQRAAQSLDLRPGGGAGTVVGAHHGSGRRCLDQPIAESGIYGGFPREAWAVGPPRRRRATARLRASGAPCSGANRPRIGSGMDDSEIEFDERGLVPCVVQDWLTGEVLMHAYMNAESLRLTRQTGEAHFFSRSRQRLWHKGETSGNTLAVKA